MNRSCIVSKLFFIITLLLITFKTSLVFAAHGISIDGKLKYPEGFSKFDYASEKAAKGGHLVMHDLGSFDKMNPYTLKGIPPAGLELLVFETLAIPSLDELFAEYGLIAKDIELAPDRLSITYTINEKAKFSDGTPITPEDIKFSLETMKSEAAHPFYQAYYQDISHAEILDSQRVRFYFHQANRELHMIASQIPVFSKKFYSEHSFNAPSLIPPMGSGPYVVEHINPGKSITYKRNPDYWAIDHPVRRGMFNYDTITYKYFKDQLVSVEAFKAGDFDFMYINIAKQWARDIKGEKFDKKEFIKETLAHKNNQGMQGFVFNTRKELFADRRIRKALCLAFDFEWANKTLFFNQYTRSNSYFSNSLLAAQGLPSDLELKYLSPFKDKLPSEVFTTPPTAYSTTSPNSLRKNLRQAKKILTGAGWKIQDGQLVDKQGKPFEFEILLVSPSFERVIAPYVKNLQKLGVNATYRTIDPALYVRRIKSFDYDMVVNVFGQSQSPGNEQRDYWHSTSADREGSRNLIGLKDEVIDNLVEKIIYANTQDELTAACRAIDRVLWYGYYVVPNWYLDKHRIAYRNIFERPKTLPLYYTPFHALMTWWMKPSSQ